MAGDDDPCRDGCSTANVLVLELTEDFLCSFLICYVLFTVQSFDHKKKEGSVQSCSCRHVVFFSLA